MSAVSGLILLALTKLCEASVLAPIALVPVGLLMGRKKHGSQLIGLVTVCLIVAAMVGLLSCNSNDSTTPPATNSGGGTPATGTPAGTSSVTVTATSRVEQHRRTCLANGHEVTAKYCDEASLQLLENLIT